MAKSQEKQEALRLRREGTSIKGIAKELDVSSSSVSIWVRDLVLTKDQQENLIRRQIAAGHRGRMIGVEVNRQKKNTNLKFAKEQALSDVVSITRDQLFYIGLGLYWGEGFKGNASTAGVCNSDPRVMKLMVRWFSECFDVEPNRFQLRVFISNTHQDREEVITRFWTNALKIPRSQFRRMIFLDKGKKIYENRDVYYGVLSLRIAKGKDILYRILAYIERVSEIVS